MKILDAEVYTKDAEDLLLIKIIYYAKDDTIVYHFNLKSLLVLHLIDLI